jgi:glucokinase
VPSGGGDAPPAAADGRALAADARAGDPVALAAYERAGTMLGRGIASAVALLDVTTVVVGGGFAASGDLLFAPLRAAYARHAGLPHVRAARVLPAALGADTGLLGAAALVLAGHRYWTGD